MVFTCVIEMVLVFHILVYACSQEMASSRHAERQVVALERLIDSTPSNMLPVEMMGITRVALDIMLERSIPGTILGMQRIFNMVPKSCYMDVTWKRGISLSSLFHGY